jgi:hypothetical protein
LRQCFAAPSLGDLGDVTSAAASAAAAAAAAANNALLEMRRTPGSFVVTFLASCSLPAAENWCETCIISAALRQCLAAPALGDVTSAAAAAAAVAAAAAAASDCLSASAAFDASAGSEGGRGGRRFDTLPRL